jgi:hypothetical protein
MENENHGHLNDVVVNQDAAIPEGSESEQVASESENYDNFDRKFAALSRKERDIRARETELAELEDKFRSMEQEPEVPLEHRLRSNPLKVLEELGLGYETLTDLALNDGKLTPDMQMQLIRDELEADYQSKFHDLERKLEERDARDQDEKYNSILSGFMDEIKNHVASDEKYELIQANDASDVVYEVMEEHYEESGNILSIDEAAEAVESYLEEEAEKLLNLQKIKSRLSGNELESRDDYRQSQITLSNAHAAQANERVGRSLSDEESKRAIAQMLKWDD